MYVSEETSLEREETKSVHESHISGGHCSSTPTNSVTVNTQSAVRRVKVEERCIFFFLEIHFLLSNYY
jgi:hypothetical protein